MYRRNVFPEDGYADLHHLESQAVWCHHISLLRALFSKSGPSAKLFEEPRTRDAEYRFVDAFYYLKSASFMNFSPFSNQALANFFANSQPISKLTTTNPEPNKLPVGSR